jgi:predicted nucleic acid-binding protein
MTLVVDASIAVRWLFPVSHDSSADELVRFERLIAPDLVITEITNAAWKFVTFEGLAPEAAATIVASAEGSFEELVPSTALNERALMIAVELKHPVYDCLYLALAEQRDCQVVTADKRFLAKCLRTPFAKQVKSLDDVGSGRRR